MPGTKELLPDQQELIVVFCFFLFFKKPSIIHVIITFREVLTLCYECVHNNNTAPFCPFSPWDKDVPLYVIKLCLLFCFICEQKMAKSCGQKQYTIM